MFTHHTYCRACGLGKPQLSTLKVVTGDVLKNTDNKLIEVMDLGIMPLANDFADYSQEHAGYAPLKLVWCPRCSLGQLSVVVNPKVLYANYPYVTSHGSTMKDHFTKLMEDLLNGCKPGTVVEIGSNDGTFLKYCMDSGFSKVLGVEPASNLCRLAEKNQVGTINEFFNEEVAEKISSIGVVPDLIVARHVFCHINDWVSVIQAIGRLCEKHTLVAIEVPYFVDTIKKMEWDQIYHEHLSYMTLKSMEWALKGSALHIHAVRKYSIHGGAVVILLRRDDCDIPSESMETETLTIGDLVKFKNKSEQLVNDLKNQVTELVNQGKTVVGYGASAKATQWIHRCGFTKKHIKFVCDETHQKMYKFMPGTDIPVVDPGALTREIPDYAVCFAWNFFNEIKGKESHFNSNGGKWIVPVPDVRIV